MKVCMLQAHSRNNNALWECTLKNHSDYCTRHSYDMMQVYREYHECRWDWLLYNNLLLQHYDMVVVIGSDVIITKQEKPLSDFWDPNYGLVVSAEKVGGSTLNNDIQIWQKGLKAEQCINLLYNRRVDLDSHPWFCQQAMLELAETSCGKNLIKVLPVRELQSAPVSSYPESAWQKGDFSLHFLGMSNEDKLMRSEHFLRTGEVLWRQ